MADYYSENGDEPVTDDELRSYFSENFIAFKAVTGYLPSGSDTVSLKSRHFCKILRSMRVPLMTVRA